MLYLLRYTAQHSRNKSFSSLHCFETCWIAKRMRPQTLISRTAHGGAIGRKLERAILKTKPENLLISSKDKTALALLRNQVYKTLDLQQELPLKDTYESAESYHEAIASCIVEEALYSIVTDVETKFGFDQSKGAPKTTGVQVQIVKNEAPFFQCYSTEPLKYRHRNELRSGTVVILCPIDAAFSKENITFGTIQHGSFESTILPPSMQPTNEESQLQQDKKMSSSNNDTALKKIGDRLNFFVYREGNFTSIIENMRLQMYPVSSILSFSRQFQACFTKVNLPLKETLLGELREKELKELSADNHNAISNKEWHTDPLSFETTMSIPELNASQEQVASNFLSAKGSDVQVVQGPPGTGKSTMTAAIICRYILKARAEGNVKKLLVCGPTNKSVTVLLKKVMEICDHNDTIKLALTGNASELLSDDKEQLENVYAPSYIKLKQIQFKRIGKDLLKSEKIDDFEDQAMRFIQKMRNDIPGVNLSEVEAKINQVSKSFDDPKVDIDCELSPNFWAESQDTNDEGDAEGYRKQLKNDIAKAHNALWTLDQQTATQNLLEGADVVFCTLSSAGSVPIQRMGAVDDVIIDEASACTEGEVLIPLQKSPKRMLLIGDPLQLPATVKSPVAIQRGLERSLQDRLMFANKHDYTLLDTQYRMRPEISRWPVKQFYDGKVIDGGNVQDPLYVADFSFFQNKPYVFIDVPGQEKKDKFGSTWNPSEGDAVVSLLCDLSARLGVKSFHPDRLRIITFYKAQVQYLQQLLRKYMIHATVSTVDSSQGCESDIVILSFVRGSSGTVGFLKDTKRLNVAMTRAKHQLICVGSLTAIDCIQKVAGNMVVRDLVDDAQKHSFVLSASELPNLPKRKPTNRKLKGKKREKKNKKGSNRENK